jgi:hypothetical protein
MAYRGDEKTWRNDNAGWGEMQLFSPVSASASILLSTP